MKTLKGQKELSVNTTVNKTSLRERILLSKSYWMESINGEVYTALVEFMESKNFKQSDLAEHLGISPSRVSQILNNGEVNFSIQKLIEISLKINRIPQFRLEHKDVYFSNRITQINTNSFASHVIHTGNINIIKMPKERIASIRKNEPEEKIFSSVTIIPNS